MTQNEFVGWSSRLFVAFPSLNEWLAKNSPDKNATLRVWFGVLAKYTLAECDWVLDGWSTGKLKPFEAYERDKVHLLVASHIGYVRDQQSKRRALDASNEVYKQKQRGEFDMRAVLGDSSMVAAFEDLRPVHARVIAGTMSQQDYDAIERKTLIRHGASR
jgi:hypothetical protein